MTVADDLVAWQKPSANAVTQADASHYDLLFAGQRKMVNWPYHFLFDNSDAVYGGYQNRRLPCVVLS